MINFFRTIRQNLLAGNKFSKYLVYAIGEIILVVIGILIALQINNWNEERKEKQLETQLIDLLISDLEEKKGENITDLDIGTRMIERFQEGIDIWEQEGRIDTNNLKQNLGTLGTDIYFQNEGSPIYSGLSSSNFWKQIPDSLNKQIDHVYRIRLRRVGIAFDKASEYGTFCRLNFLAPNDLVDQDRETGEMLKKVEPVKEEYIRYSKLFISAANRVKGRLEASANEIETLIKNLHHYKETQ